MTTTPKDLADPDVFMGRVLINGMPYRRQMIRVAKITVGRSTCVVKLSDLIDTIDGGETYEVCITEMRKSEFDRMEEFQGW